MTSWVNAGVVGRQVFHVVFLLLHDWIPLGRLNDVASLRAVYPVRKVLSTSVVSAAPFVALLVSSWHAAGLIRFPLSLRIWLWIGYGWLFAGELYAWWIPYFRGGDPSRVERYSVMFGQTYAFLPERNGITPNALHTLLHMATFALLILLFWL